MGGGGKGSGSGKGKGKGGVSVMPVAGAGTIGKCRDEEGNPVNCKISPKVIGIIVGSVVGFTVLCVGIYFFFRWRFRRMGAKTYGSVPVDSETASTMTVAAPISPPPNSPTGTFSTFTNEDEKEKFLQADNDNEKRSHPMMFPAY